jgi:(p)ppGpp synthase/HD superfamily hydrolase
LDDTVLAGLFARAEEEIIPAHPDYDPDEGLQRFLRNLGSGSELTVQEASVLAIAAHDGQVGMYGAPHHEHLRTVARALTPYGPHLVMAGWLHDILAMTEWTARELREAGIPARVVEIVELVTPGDDHVDSIRRITQDPEATLVKIADNADSIYPERITGTPDAETRCRLAEFEEARRILWSAAPREDIITIVSPINLPLLERLTTQ